VGAETIEGQVLVAEVRPSRCGCERHVHPVIHDHRHRERAHERSGQRHNLAGRCIFQAHLDDRSSAGHGSAACLDRIAPLEDARVRDHHQAQLRPSAMSKILRGLRGATTAAAKHRPGHPGGDGRAVARAAEANGFQPEDVESAIFTSSPDLTTEYPARAARLLGWSDVPLLGAAEVAVPDGVPRCIRVLLHFYTTKPQRELKHMYLRDAAKLRPEPEEVTDSSVITRAVIVSAKGAARWEAGHPWIYRTDVYDEPRGTPAWSRHRPSWAAPRPGPVLPHFGNSAAPAHPEARDHRRDVVGRPDRRGGASTRRHTGHRVPRGPRRRDGLPSLVVDRYGPYVVAQLLSAGLEQVRATCWTESAAALAPEGSCSATTLRCGATRDCRSR